MAIPYIKADQDIYKSVTFFCPVCKEMISAMYHMYYECGCGKQWILPEPTSNDGTIPNREVS